MRFASSGVGSSGKTRPSNSEAPAVAVFMFLSGGGVAMIGKDHIR